MKKPVFYLLLLMSLLGGASALAGLQCDLCHKQISAKDKYVEYEGKVYCSQKCFARAMPKCATCGRSIAEGKGLQGGFVQTKDKFYCSEECYQKSLPLCAVCKKPTKGGLRSKEDPSKIYCSQECYQATLPKCSLCGAVMQSWTEIQGVKFCSQCAKLPACFNCQMPGAGRESKDGRRWCDSCMATAVMDSAKAEQIFRQVREDIRTHLGLSTPDTIRFQLVDADQLGRLLGHKNFAEHGLYRYNIEYKENKKKERRITRESFDIFILTGLSPENFKDVAAHELAHDINYRYFSNTDEKRDVEGFAEYVSSLMNRYWGQEKVNDSKLRNLQKEYAEAYRYFLQLGQKGGLKKVWSHMEKRNGKVKK